MKKTDEQEPRKYHDRISSAIVKAVLFSRDCWCGWMAKATGRLTIGTQKVVFGGLGAALSVYYAWSVLVPLSRNSPGIPESGSIVKVETEKGPVENAPSGNWMEVDSAVAEFQRYRDSVQSLGGDAWAQFREHYKLK